MNHWSTQEIGRAFPEDLVGEMQVAEARVPGLGGHRPEGYTQVAPVADAAGVLAEHSGAAGLGASSQGLRSSEAGTVASIFTGTNLHPIC